LIPQKATFEILDKKYVYVVDDKGIVHSRQITVGTELPHIYVVTSGLKEGENVLIEGLRKVKNQQHIKLKSEHPRKVLAEMNQLFAE
jgi:membrane fusion protein (multidrug efflux system)